MPEIVIIDGNNLLHAVRVLGPTRPPGREKLTRLIERWAVETHNHVMLVFDGPAPAGPFGKQMQSQAVELVFSGMRTADDCIVERLKGITNADHVKVISDDTAIRYEARQNNCRLVSTTAFIASLFPPSDIPKREASVEASAEKPAETSNADRQTWLEVFDDGAPEEPFDGFEAMQF